jgi:hypothetical protein
MLSAGIAVSDTILRKAGYGIQISLLPLSGSCRTSAADIPVFVDAQDAGAVNFKVCKGF